MEDSPGQKALREYYDVSALPTPLGPVRLNDSSAERGGGPVPLQDFRMTLWFSDPPTPT